MKIIIKIIILFKAIIAQPLSILRFSLSILMGKYLLERLNDIYSLENISQYALSKTWFLKLLPDSFLTLDISQYNILKYSILISALCAAIGFLGRLNLLILAFLCFYIFGIGEGIGVFDHHASLPSQVIFALALVPGSMKLSLDYLFLYIYYKQKRYLQATNLNINLALEYYYLEDFITAKKYLNKAEQFEQNQLATRNLYTPSIYTVQSAIYVGLEEYDKAVKSTLALIKYYKESNSTTDYALAYEYSHLSEIYDQLKDDENSLDYSLKALNLMQATGIDAPNDIAPRMINIGLTYLKMNRTSTAKKYLLQSIKLIKNVDTKTSTP